MRARNALLAAVVALPISGCGLLVEMDAFGAGSIPSEVAGSLPDGSLAPEPARHVRRPLARSQRGKGSRSSGYTAPRTDRRARRKREILPESERFVRRILTDVFDQTADDRLVRDVAAKVSMAVPRR
jgi:hypothetical protein